MYGCIYLSTYVCNVFPEIEAVLRAAIGSAVLGQSNKYLLNPGRISGLPKEFSRVMPLPGTPHTVQHGNVTAS